MYFVVFVEVYINILFIGNIVKILKCFCWMILVKKKCIFKFKISDNNVLIVDSVKIFFYIKYFNVLIIFLINEIFI